MKSSIRHVALMGALLLLVALPSAVSAHAEIVSESPENGATVQTGPLDIIATFSDTLKSSSRLELRDSTGAVVARGAVDGKTMRIGLEGIQPGEYEVIWQSVAEDGDILKSTQEAEWEWKFTVAEASPSLTPSPVITAAPSQSASIAPSLAASAAPSPSAAPTNPSTSSSNDALLPIIAALVAVALLGALLLRRRPPTAR
jgi:methionine-rich copper-binding protein CopC